MHRRLVPSKLSGIVWVSVLAATGVVTVLMRADRTDFRGIAEDAKQSVSSASAVEILEIKVQPGQIVSVGDTLLRLRDHELSVRIAEILHDIQDASGDASLNKAESQRRISELGAAYQSRKAEYLGEIRTLQEQRDRNRALVSSFQAMGVRTSDSSGETLQDRIQALEHQIKVEEAGMRSQVALLEGSKGDLSRLAATRDQAIRTELALLREEESRLTIRALASGVVDSINFRVGEKVSPFAPILTISGHRPTLVRGYVHEKLPIHLALGDSVDVSTVGMRTARFRGVVVGLGSRIMELPMRLWKIPNYPLWGREVIVRIPSDNPLLLGEMVNVHRGAIPLGGPAP
jgi:multidrug resistance efflux pump